MFNSFVSDRRIHAYCEDCGKPLCDLTGYHSRRVGDTKHWYCLRCADAERPLRYQCIRLMWMSV